MSLANPGHQDARLRGIREEEHPFWTQAFRSELRHEQLAEDHHAWASVTGTLLTIVTIGVTLAVISVLMCL